MLFDHLQSPTLEKLDLAIEDPLQSPTLKQGLRSLEEEFGKMKFPAMTDVTLRLDVHMDGLTKMPAWVSHFATTSVSKLTFLFDRLISSKQSRRPWESKRTYKAWIL